MPQNLFVALGVLLVLGFCMLVFARLKRAVSRLFAAIAGFLLIFCAVFLATSWATGAAPPIQDLLPSLRSPDYWKANVWAAVAGVVLAGLSARMLLARKA